MKHLDSKAFTIVELLIVLAVAGMIFLVIFLSLPALIRNGHNNQRKQDVTAVLSAISQYQLSHSGNNFPTTSAACDATCASTLLKYTKLSFYEKANVSVHVESAGGAIVTTVSNDEVHIYNYHLCDATNSGIISAGAGYRDVVALYNIETRSSLAVKCQQL